MLEDLIAECCARGFLVSNLFQLDSGLWQANLRTRTHCAQFGQGSTPYAALDNALALSTELIPLPEQQTCVGHIEDAAMNLSELMSLVTITKSKPAPNPFRGKL